MQKSVVYLILMDDSEKNSVTIVKPSTIRVVEESKPLKLSCGKCIAPVDVTYETLGQLNDNRDNAINTMKRALREFKISPIKTTIPVCLEILRHNLYVKNKIDTTFIEKHME